MSNARSAHLRSVSCHWMRKWSRAALFWHSIAACKTTKTLMSEDGRARLRENLYSRNLDIVERACYANNRLPHWDRCRVRNSARLASSRRRLAGRFSSLLIHTSKLSHARGPPLRSHSSTTLRNCRHAWTFSVMASWTTKMSRRLLRAYVSFFTSIHSS